MNKPEPWLTVINAHTGTGARKDHAFIPFSLSGRIKIDIQFLMQKPENLQGIPGF